MRTLEFLPGRFSVMKLREMPSAELLGAPFTFFARTDGEISLVCREERYSGPAVAREDGWRAFRVRGTMEFALIGILAQLSDALARAGVSLFAVSTYDTDYVLIKEESLAKARAALAEAGYELADAENTAR